MIQNIGGSLRNVQWGGTHQKALSVAVGDSLTTDSGTFSGHLLNAVRNAGNLHPADSRNDQVNASEILDRKSASHSTEKEKYSDRLSSQVRVQFNEQQEVRRSNSKFATQKPAATDN